jgi:transcriptional regulator with XRE-family HTH domain
MSARDMFFAEDAKFSRADEKFMARSSLVYNVTEDILVVMEKLGISKKELARALGKSQSHVSQLLDGARNMTLGTLSDITYTLGADIKIKVGVDCPGAHASDWHVMNAAELRVPSVVPIVTTLKRVPARDRAANTWFYGEKMAANE